MIPILNHAYPVHTFPPYFPKIHSNITRIFPHTPRSSEWLLPSDFPTIILYAFVIPPMRVTYSANLEVYKLWSSSLCSPLQPPSYVVCTLNVFTSILRAKNWWPVRSGARTSAPRALINRAMGRASYTARPHNFMNVTVLKQDGFWPDAELNPTPSEGNARSHYHSEQMRSGSWVVPEGLGKRMGHCNILGIYLDLNVKANLSLCLTKHHAMKTYPMFN